MGYALVQGASRGIGLQFCRHLLNKRPTTFVIATCRQPDSAAELQSLLEDYPARLQIMQLDVSNEEKIASTAREVKEHLHDNKSKGLDLLINCAGMLHPSGRGETSLKAVSQEGLMSTFATNAFGPLLMAKYFGEHLTKGSGEFGQSSSDGHSGVLVNMSARVGSISDNGYGGWYSYRMSKSALNMASKNLSIEFSRGRRKVICVSLHPGTVDTDLSRPYHKNVPVDKLFTSEYSVERMMKVIENLTVEDSGKFFDFAGKEIPF
ncbi:C-factor-like [Lytechinus variegatus]|uniref:C-factor-like n=1 Tax=Lytechinus variegatus TaxID=7654 RepID=UPI001BB2A9E7|nr:C-factor-like [Lytechinus variegatus]